MSNFSALIATIQANIKTNGQEEITGAILQDVLEAMVQALGTEAINNLEMSLSTLSRTVSGIEGKIPSAATSSNKLTDKAYVDEADTTLTNAVNAIKDNIDNGFVYAGIATPSGTPTTGRIFYLAVTAGTYTNYGGLVVTQGINILKYDGTNWSQEQLICIDNEPTINSNNLVKSGGVYSSLMRGYLAGCDLNTVQNNGTYLLYSSQTYQNSPNNANTGFLRVSKVVPAFILQEFYEFNTGTLYKRRFESDLSVVNPWEIVNARYVDGQIDILEQYINDTFMTSIKGVVYLSQKTKKTPTSSVTGKWVDVNGGEHTASYMEYQIFAVDTGKKYVFSGKILDTDNTMPYILWYDSDSQLIKADFRRAVNGLVYVYEYLEVPSNAAYAYMNVQTSQAAVYDGFYELGDIVDVSKEVVRWRGILPSGSSLNDVKEDGFWLVFSNDPTVYTDGPMSPVKGFLRMTSSNVTWGIQEFYSFDDGELFQRRIDKNESSQRPWKKVSGDVTNNYTFNSYPQTVNVTATPTITTDTNQYLAATGDTTDRTSAILTLLNQTGVCRLGPGDFYVKNLVMPDKTSIIGSGSKTRVILDSSVSDGFAIKIGSECMVKDFWLKGFIGDIVPNSTVGTRHGLMWQGDYTQSQTAPNPSIVSDVFITDFHGGGITCYDTGVGTYNFLDVCNVIINGCDAGINISYWSEFHKFTNVRTCFCHFGCINNGGNNVFVNCDFSQCRGIAFLMDNSQNQSPNNSHGSCVGCVFNHTASDAGLAIEILNCNNGFMFTGCQLFYGGIRIEDSLGIVFDACNFGFNANVSIYVSGGISKSILFSNVIILNPQTITVLNGAEVHLVNCYNKNTGELITL